MIRGFYKFLYQLYVQQETPVNLILVLFYLQNCLVRIANHDVVATCYFTLLGQNIFLCTRIFEHTLSVVLS